MASRNLKNVSLGLLLACGMQAGHAAAQSDAPLVINDYNAKEPLELQHTTASWAVRVGPFSGNENSAKVVKRILALDKALSDKEVQFVSRQEAGTAKSSIYGEVTGLKTATAERTCKKAKAAGWSCSTYDFVWNDIARRAFLRQLALSVEPHKIGIAAQECYAKAITSAYAENLASCFYLEYAYVVMANSFNDPFWQGQANLTKANLQHRINAAFTTLKTPSSQQEALLNGWQQTYAETTAWYSAKSMDELRTCGEVGIRTEQCP